LLVIAVVLCWANKAPPQIEAQAFIGWPVVGPES